MGVATVPALTSSVALNRFAVVVVPLAPIWSMSFGLFGELADVRKSGTRKPTKLVAEIVMVIVAVLVPLTLVALIKPVYGPTAVGVPENCPFTVLNVIPGTETVVP